MNNNSLTDEFAPTQFFLSQNYPNPFSERSVIKYCVPLKTKVNISVYNTEGEVLRVLVNDIKNPGTYETEIYLVSKSSTDKYSLADGNYFYQMTTEEFSSEKKWFCVNHLSGKLNMKTMLQFFW